MFRRVYRSMGRNIVHPLNKKNATPAAMNTNSANVEPSMNNQQNIQFSNVIFVQPANANNCKSEG